jgi:uncharacterized protein YlaN (UPF0358 family)
MISLSFIIPLFDEVLKIETYGASREFSLILRK